MIQNVCQGLLKSVDIIQDSLVFSKQLLSDAREVGTELVVGVAPVSENHASFRKVSESQFVAEHEAFLVLLQSSFNFRNQDFCLLGKDLLALCIVFTLHTQRGDFS